MSDQAELQAPMNLIGWVLVVVGAVGLLTSVAGVFYIFVRPSPAKVLASSATELYLHDTYYVISRPVYAVWPLLLCLVLSAAISIVGYMHTENFIRRMIPVGDQPIESQLPSNEA
jgi:hypothetical protein